jgi:hypothetical protein
VLIFLAHGANILKAILMAKMNRRKRIKLTELRRTQLQPLTKNLPAKVRVKARREREIKSKTLITLKTTLNSKSF